MSWSSPVRALGVCGLWLAVQTGCGGNPSVNPTDHKTLGGSDAGGTGNTGNTGDTAGTLNFDTAGDGPISTGGTSDKPVTKYECGNGKLEPGEFCDDGNTAESDGCSADCTTLDLDYDCSAIGETCVRVVICGDGVLQGDEACDDKNTADDDGCSADCSKVEDGWMCVRPGNPCVEVSVCGNGVRQRGEACDEGAANKTDGCNDQCQITPGWYCPGPGMSCVQEICGDGVRTRNEACDDGQAVPKSGDGCSATCTVEDGWHCNMAGCKPECGDGLLKGTEACDDGNATGGDGCSSACTVEPFFSCNNATLPSKCGSSIQCGNNKIEPGEICDPPGTDGCKAGCKSFDLINSAPAVCGNNIIEDGEGCEPKNPGKGCSNLCQVENGWTCPPLAACTRNPFCGDNTVDFAQGETCDPPSAGCTAACAVKPGWTCVGAGPSTCVQPMCGNNVIEPGEQCDDGPGANADGCVNCLVVDGWVCPAAGQACQARCGDGKKLGLEECDDKNKASGDGCSAGCQVELGYKCTGAGPGTCQKSVCGNGLPLDAGEGCDDGNKIAGDGCGPTCQKEPTVVLGTDPEVKVSCGDGLITGTEQCDDGNKASGDGCSAPVNNVGGCKVEVPGWSCDNTKLDLPDHLDMQVTFRDFKGGNATAGDGHTDFQYGWLNHVADLTGAPCKTDNQGMMGTCGRLDAQGKPVLNTTVNNQATSGIMSAATFGLWYRDTNTGNNAVKNHLGNVIAMKPPFVRTLTLDRVPDTEAYVYDSFGNNFYPLDGVANTFGRIGDEVPACDNAAAGLKNVTGNPGCDGCTGGCLDHNFSFTSELRYFFQYKGGETLSFIGDDDVWVYINGRLAVDIGGLHGATSGQVVLGDDGNGPGAGDSDCSAHAAALPDPAGGCYTQLEKDDPKDDRFVLDKGGLYEIVLFHAERHTTASDFKLTLAGFLAPRSFCTTKCGDGHIAGNEFCDDGPPPNGNSDAKAGGCLTDCTARAFCGDKLKQVGEACDDGINTTLYNAGSAPGGACAPGCSLPGYCGDKTLQAGQGEKCDNGSANDDNSYGPTSCKKNCTLGGYCGDNIPQAAGGEACDLGPNNGKGHSMVCGLGNTTCSYECKPGPCCGDSVRNGPEECDDGANNGSINSHCSGTCTIKAYCGDGIKQGTEECDYGQFASTEYGGCTTLCTFGPHCGDGTPANTPDLEEECDTGTANNTGGYDGCTNKCALGPRCGDGKLQSDHGEICDNGFNADDYDDPNTVEAECGANCMPPPYCGDHKVQPAHELCDNGDDNNDATYNGCTKVCEFGPYCGDSHTDMPDETCDDGTDNVAYSAAQGGCGFDCQAAPYCGDGERNGPEQCDNGEGKNDGAYGGCNVDCSFAPRCGDGKKQDGEQCDDGPGGSLKCTPGCKRRDVVQ